MVSKSSNRSKQNENVESFSDFIRLAEKALRNASEIRKVEFMRFVDKGVNILSMEARDVYDQLIPFAEVVRPWVFQHNLLETAQVFSEDALTELIAWVLHPSTHPESSGLRQNAWIQRILPNRRLSFTKPAVPCTQFWSDDGVPDMVLQYDNFVLVLEAKLDASEHPTPTSGQFQTISYPPAVRRTLKLPLDFPVYMVFMTPDGRKAANPEASNTTYVEFCFAMASAICRGSCCNSCCGSPVSDSLPAIFCIATSN